METTIEEKFHVPSGVLLELGGIKQFRYITLLEVGTPQAMQDQIATILDQHVDTWTSTEFSGDVYLACWNDTLEPQRMEAVADGLGQLLTGLQRVVNENNLTSAEGNPITLQATLSKSASEASQ